uniref:Mitochondrial import inner membrane translocase subunit n=1 Tax=Ditylenchus dipsaci TaxID=166011 RepID=A0A915CVS3_9BILA
MAQLTQQEATMKMMGDLEIEMMSDLYRRMTESCQQKCINSQFREADLSKGEAVCLDRCVYKYLDVHDRLGKVLTQMTQQDDKQLQQVAHEQKQK